MRYSEVIGQAYYGIGLSAQDSYKVDLHFTAAAHHYFRMMEAAEFGDEAVWDFHAKRHVSHLRALAAVVYTNGDFSQARDESGRGLEFREMWDPAVTLKQDPDEFEEMEPDEDYPVGVAHPNDVLLGDHHSAPKSTKH